MPSHASLFTGLPPFAHGAHTFETDKPGNNVAPLAHEHLTLAEALEGEGYRTGAFVANAGYLGRRWQLDQGFETYEVARTYAVKLNRRIFDWLAVEDERPFFLFINYMDAHRPYNTRPRPGFIDPPARRDNGKLLNKLISAVMREGGSVPEQLRQQVIDQYDTAVANVDEGFGAFLDELERLGLDGETIVLFTSDHGEYFGEHRLVEHSKDVYEEALRVPLIVRAPGGIQGVVDKTLVVSNDVPHLLLSLFPRGIRRRLLPSFPDAPGEHVVLAENYFTRTKDLFRPRTGHRFRRVRRAVFDWPYKYIWSSDERHELYHLEDDPTESTNLAPRAPGIAARLNAELEELDRTPGMPRPPVTLPALTEEESERLRALGYLGD